MGHGGLEPVEPDRLADAREADLGVFRRGARVAGGAALLGRDLLRGRGGGLVAGHELGDDVGEPEETLLEVGPVEREKDVEDVLRGLEVADGEIGLEEVEPGGRAVAGRVVVRGNQLDQLAHVAADAEFAGNRHEHIGPRARAGEDLGVDGDGRGDVARLEFRLGVGEAGQGATGDRLAGLRGGFVGGEKSHAAASKVIPAAVAMRFWARAFRPG